MDIWIRNWHHLVLFPYIFLLHCRPHRCCGKKKKKNVAAFYAWFVADPYIEHYSQTNEKIEYNKLSESKAQTRARENAEE